MPQARRSIPSRPAARVRLAIRFTRATRGIAIDLLHQRLRRAGDQPDVGIGAGQVGGKPRMNYRKRRHMMANQPTTPLPAASAPPRGGQSCRPQQELIGQRAAVRSLPVRQGSPAPSAPPATGSAANDAADSARKLPNISCWCKVPSRSKNTTLRSVCCKLPPLSQNSLLVRVSLTA
ncbi:Uncharacterised protein [Klebsiella pneumoniae]|uniref:Uncharacterized protein n=1 Tax=Klebsiella pneumoniae TaxID=573 RepID=A0A378FWZ1_KLEPN|nr:Uncharacterised protein [Klebsiella pneumoniae]